MSWSLEHVLLVVLALLLGVFLGWLVQGRRLRSAGAAKRASRSTANVAVTKPEPEHRDRRTAVTAPAGPATAPGESAPDESVPADPSDAVAVRGRHAAEAKERRTPPEPVAADVNPGDPFGSPVVAAAPAAAGPPPGRQPAVDDRTAEPTTADAVQIEHAEPQALDVAPAEPVTAGLPEPGISIARADARADDEPTGPPSTPLPDAAPVADATPLPEAAPLPDATPVADATPLPESAPQEAAVGTDGLPRDADRDGARPGVTAGQPDDFRRIQGIGPKVAAALVAAGIRTFAELADSDEATLREAMRRAGVRSAATLPSWALQARALSAEASSRQPAG